MLEDKILFEIKKVDKRAGEKNRLFFEGYCGFVKAIEGAAFFVV